MIIDQHWYCLSSGASAVVKGNAFSFNWGMVGFWSLGFGFEHDVLYVVLVIVSKNGNVELWPELFVLAKWSKTNAVFFPDTIFLPDTCGRAQISQAVLKWRLWDYQISIVCILSVNLNKWDSKKLLGKARRQLLLFELTLQGGQLQGAINSNCRWES